LLTLALKDMQGHPLEMPLADIHIAVSALKSAHVSALTQKQAGVYTVTVAAGSEAEDITLTPVLGNLTLGAAQVLISYSPPDGAHSTLVAEPKSITADDKHSATLTFTAKDTQCQPIPGIASTLSFQVLDIQGHPAMPGAVTVSPTTESAVPGVYSTQLSGKKAGSYQVIPQVNGKAVGHLSDTVTLMAATGVQDILVNGHRFAPKKCFPTTGFTGARFTVGLNRGSPHGTTTEAPAPRPEQRYHRRVW